MFTGLVLWSSASMRLPPWPENTAPLSAERHRQPALGRALRMAPVATMFDSLNAAFVAELFASKLTAAEAKERDLIGRSLHRVAARRLRVGEVEEQLVRRARRTAAPRAVLHLIDAEHRRLDDLVAAVVDALGEVWRDSLVTWLRKLPPVPCARRPAASRRPAAAPFGTVSDMQTFCVRTTAGAATLIRPPSCGLR